MPHASIDEVVVWNINEALPVKRVKLTALSNEFTIATDVEFSQDIRLLAISVKKSGPPPYGDSEGRHTVYMLNVESGEVIHSFNAKGCVRLSFDHVAMNLLAFATEGIVYRMETSSGQLRMATIGKKSELWFDSFSLPLIDFSFDGKYMLSGYKQSTGRGSESEIEVWDISNQ